MKRNSRWSVILVVAVATVWLIGQPIAPAQAADPVSYPLAYVGPGAGLGLLGSLFAVLMVVFVGLAGLVLHPLKLMIRWLRRNRSFTGAAGAPGSDSLVVSERT
jgi:hypothetical protein